MAASTLPEVWKQALDDDGNPYPGALLYSYAAGTDTPQALYSDSDLDVPLSNPVEADDGGFFPVMYCLPTGYKLRMTTALDVLVRFADDIVDEGAVFASTFGDQMTGNAALGVTSGYVVLPANVLVTVASVGATTINLPAVATKNLPVLIKNMQGGTVVLNPNGAETFEGSLTEYTIEAAATPLFPSVWLYPGTGTWWIFSSHRAA